MRIDFDLWNDYHRVIFIPSFCVDFDTRSITIGFLFWVIEIGIKTN